MEKTSLGNTHSARQTIRNSDCGRILARRCCSSEKWVCATRYDVWYFTRCGRYCGIHYRARNTFIPTSRRAGARGLPDRLCSKNVNYNAFPSPASICAPCNIFLFLSLLISGARKDYPLTPSPHYSSIERCQCGLYDLWMGGAGQQCWRFQVFGSPYDNTLPRLMIIAQACGLCSNETASGSSILPCYYYGIA